MSNNTGWTCPTCKKSFAPSVGSCKECNEKIVSAKSEVKVKKTKPRAFIAHKKELNYEE